jgi:hypothetical protein
MGMGRCREQHDVDEGRQIVLMWLVQAVQGRAPPARSESRRTSETLPEHRELNMPIETSEYFIVSTINLQRVQQVSHLPATQLQPVNRPRSM